MIRKKACAIILRRKRGKRQILVFRHPDGTVQFVKGNLKRSEKPKRAAIRELKEESGIKGLRAVKLIGVWNSEHRNQVWYFYRCKPEKPLPDRWKFYTKDGGGQTFEFFWFDLKEKPGDDWKRRYRRALKFVKKSI